MKVCFICLASHVCCSVPWHFESPEAVISHIKFHRNVRRLLGSSHLIFTFQIVDTVTPPLCHFKCAVLFTCSTSQITVTFSIKYHHINPSQYSFSQNNGRQSASPNYLYHSIKRHCDSRYNRTKHSTTKIVSRVGTDDEVIIALPEVRRQPL